MVGSSYTVRGNVGELAQLARREAITMAARMEVIRACSERVARILIEQDYSRGIGKDNDR